MRIDSSGNKITKFHSHSCSYRNLWFDWTAARNSVMNFEIEVADGITETNGGEAVLIAGQSNQLAHGSIAPVPNGEIAVRMTNGTRQTIRDVDFVGTAGSSAPLISVEQELKDSTIAGKCYAAGTFLELFPVYTWGTARGSTNTTIQLAAATGLGTNELNDMTIFITGGTGSPQARTITAYAATTGVATVSPAWTMPNPTSGSTYAVRRGRLGPRNNIRLTAETGTVSRMINLPPTWDDTNTIIVDGLHVRGSITDVSAANSAVITSRGHGLSSDDKIAIAAVEGEAAVNSTSPQVHTVTFLTSTFAVLGR
jgi:hypothetical protein